MTTSSLQDIRDYLSAVSGTLSYNLTSLSNNITQDISNLNFLAANVSSSLDHILTLVNNLPTASVILPPTASVPLPTGSVPVPTGSVSTGALATGSISFNYPFTNMVVGELIIATAKIGVSPITSSAAWQVSPAGVVSLALDGYTARITAVAPGKATLTATLPDGRIFIATGSVIGTTPPPPVTSSIGIQAIRSDDVAASVGVATKFSYFNKFPYGTNAQATINTLKSSGIRFIRDDNFVDTNTGSNAQFWGALKTIVSGGIRVILTTSPTYLGNNVWDGYPYMNQSPIDYAIGQLGGAWNILAFEGPSDVDLNEAAWGGINGYGSNAKTFQTNMFNRVKLLAPNTKVLGYTVTSAFGAVSASDISAVMDAQAMHPYPVGQTPASNILANISFLSQYINKSNKPYWITETGYYTAPSASVNVYQPSVSLTAHGKYIPRTYLMSIVNNIPYTTCFELSDEAHDASDAAMNFGLLNSDGSEKPGFTALKNMLAVISEKTLSGTTFLPKKLNAVFTGLNASVQSLVMQKSTGTFIVALWQEVSVYNTTLKMDIVNPPQNVGITLGQSFSKINLYTPLISSVPIAVNPASISLSVPDHVILLELIP